MSIPENHELRALLLHTLGEAESRALEERVMAEDGVQEALQEAENDLLDDYASGRLSEPDRAGVERHLLATSEARQRLAVARALNRTHRGASNVTPFVRPGAATQGRRNPRRTWQVVFAAAACVALVAILLPYGLHRPAATTDLLLLADSERGTPSRSVSIAAPARDVRLEVEIPMISSTSIYGVEVLDAQGQRLYSASDLRARDVSGYTVVDLVVPAQAFAAGERTVVLRESQGAGTPASPVELFRWQVLVSK